VVNMVFNFLAMTVRQSRIAAVFHSY
jgi:hypothetical protein